MNSLCPAVSGLQDEWPALSASERVLRFRDLSREPADEFFRELGATDQASLLAQLPPADRRAWFRALPPDDAADCLQAADARPLCEELLGYLDEPSRRAFPRMIISSGGNSGSQTTTLVIRAMALGELRLSHWRRVLSRELVAGLALGVMLGAIGLARVAAWQALFGSYGGKAGLLAATVGLSLVGVVVWGGLSRAMLPFGLRAIGMDPAGASAPLVATVVDVTGIVIYFSVARALLGGAIG